MSRTKIFWLTVLGSLVAGAVAGYLTATFVLPMQFDRLASELKLSLSSATSTAQSAEKTPEIVQVERRPLTPSIPSGLVTHTRTAVVRLVKRVAPGKTLEDRLIGPEREIGSAVTLSADGWLVTTFSALGGMRISDLAAVWNGRTYPLLQAIRDKATDAVFLKIDASELPVTAFVRPEDVGSGVAVWIEPRPSRLYPEIVVDAAAKNGGEPSVSERAIRRFLVSGIGDGSWQGGAVWDGTGQLIGLMESKTADGWRVLPAGDLTSALSSLLATKEIRHAFLGLRVSELAGLTFDLDRGGLPANGTWLRSDRHAPVSPAVSPQSPAKSLLAEGDVIERVERDILDGTADLGERLLDYRPDTTVTLSVRRQSGAFQTSVKLGSIVTSEILK